MDLALRHEHRSDHQCVYLRSTEDTRRNGTCRLPPLPATGSARAPCGAFASGDSQVTCRLQAVLPVATQYDPQSTFYMEKEYEARNTYNLYRQAERFDVIHAHWTTLAPYFSALTTIPTLVTYAYIEKELHQYYQKHFPRCLPVCVSHAQANMLGDDSIPVVYNGVDLDEIPFNDRPEDFFMIVGRMTPGKGIAEAIRIAKKSKVKLLIVGHVTTHLLSEEYF